MLSKYKRSPRINRQPGSFTNFFWIAAIFVIVLTGFVYFILFYDGNGDAAAVRPKPKARVAASVSFNTTADKLSANVAALSEPAAQQKGVGSQSKLRTSLPRPTDSSFGVISPSIKIPNKPQEDKVDPLYVIFSTDCAEFQDWQTLLLFHSAYVVRQRGHMVRIATGCDEEKKRRLRSLYSRLYAGLIDGDDEMTRKKGRIQTFAVHFTPVFEMKYVYNNKPRGLQHWLKYATPSVQKDAVIALLDPDMILVRPLTHVLRTKPHSPAATVPIAEAGTLTMSDLLHPDVLFSKHALTAAEVQTHVTVGKPIAQTYGLGAPWASHKHAKFNTTFVCGATSVCTKVKENFSSKHFAVGPPYIVHYNDMVKIADTWSEFVPRVHIGYPHLLAEMYAYSMAAAHLELPHQQLDHYMVSNIDSGGEGWKHIDNLADPCTPPNEHGIFFSSSSSKDNKYIPLPTVIHYCQHYRVGAYMFGKRAANKQMFSCEAPLFVEPPTQGLHLANSYKTHNNQKESMSPQQAKRHAYMVCVIHRALNAALIHYKQTICNGSAAVNYNKTYMAMK